MKITELDPEKVFYWFAELCKVPHGSGNTAAISAMCEKFASDRGLRSIRDDLGNVIIFKDGTPDHSGSEPVILQGHLDMVCAKEPTCPKDMTAEGIDPVTDGEYISADGTTLGADDGIAVAYILAILDSDDLSHPPIEAVLTVDEEVGLIGASALDCSALKGRRGINIDSEEEGIFTVSCAGGVRMTCEIPLKTEPSAPKSDFVELRVSGLLGGHSGIDIDKNRQNAIIVLGRLLDRLSCITDIRICAFEGGAAMNIIPPEASAVIACAPESKDIIFAETRAFAAEAKDGFRVTEPNITITAELTETRPTCTDPDYTAKLIFAMVNAPHGVTAMDPEITGMVKSSLNMGSAKLESEKLTVTCFVRSNDNYGKQVIAERLQSYYGYLGGTVTPASDYPAWEYRSDSPLREKAVITYRELYGADPQILAIHAGLECGILSAKLDNADFISIGPDIENAHTPQERMGVGSAARCYGFLLELLKNLD